MSSVCGSYGTFEYGSLVSDHSLLRSESRLGTETVGHTRPLPRKPGVVDIWRNLLLLSNLNSDSLPLTNKGFLKYYEQGHFKESPGEPPYHIGSGVSFSVDRRELADQSQDEKPVYVAVKTLHVLKRPQPRNEDANLAMESAVDVILKELRLLTHLPLRNHDNIVRLLGYHSDQIDGQHSTERGRSDIALVMEYSPHGTLNDFLKLSAYSNYSNGEGLGLSLKVHFMRDVTAGLKALHDCGVAHGDLKLDNTLVFPDSHRKYIAKLSDFGYSLLDFSDERRRYRGLPIMRAPEVRKWGGSDGILGASDIYNCEIFSIGLMMWEILLDGHSFTTIIASELKEVGNVAMEDALNSLPRDELLLQALICSHEYEEDDAALYQVVRDAFRLSLREEPGARGSADDILAALDGRGISLRKDHRRTQRNMNPPEPLPTTTPLTLNPDRQTRLSYPSLRSLPLVVRDELVSLLEVKAHDTTATCHDRYDAQYDLAMCMISGVHTSSVSLRSGLRQLERAAELGSPDALSIIFRLYKALSMKLPAPLRESSHPLSIVELNLNLDDESTSYMSRRIIAYERLYQQEALISDFNILHQGKCLVVSRLTDLIPRLANYPIAYGPEDLECVPCGMILGVRPSQATLLHLAARLNLQSLVEYLLTPRPNSLPRNRIGNYETLSYGFLSSACEGGHLDMFLWIAQREFHIEVENSATLFHSLVKYSIEDARVAIYCLLKVAPHALQARDIGREFFSARLRGTALEFAIATDNVQLVRIFLDVIKEGVNHGSLTAIGWTNETFDTAVSLSLWRLIPVLAPMEREFRMTRPDLLLDVRYRISQGKPPLSPFGLFNIGGLNDPTLPLLIHGKSYSKAVGKTIDAVLNERCCSINDPDSDGKTALFYVVNSALCDYSLIILHQMIAKGARFAPHEAFDEVSAHILKTKNDRTSRSVLRLLLKHSVFSTPLDGYILGRSILAGNLDATRMLCGLDTDGTRLQVTFAVQDSTGKPSRSLFTGAMMARKNNVEMVRLLLSMGADPNYDARLPMQDSHPHSGPPLEEAIMSMYADVEIIHVFIEGGAHVSWGGRTVLTAAALRRNFWAHGKHITDHLLRHPKVHALKDKEWSGYGTPLTIACRCGNWGAVYALHNARADLGDDGNIESLCGIASGVAQKPWTLLGEWENELGGTKSLYQWRCKMEGLLLFLRKERGLVQGRTPLHFAVETGNAKRIVELVEADCSLVSRRDEFGRLPIDLLDDKEVPYSDDPRSYFPVPFLRRFLQRSLAQEISKNRSRDSLATREHRRDRRIVHFAAVDFLGWDSEEVRLTGQSLMIFKRRMLLNEDLVSRAGDTSAALNQIPAELQSILDSTLILNEDYGHELSIVASQHAEQAVAEFGENSERGARAQIRAVFTTLNHGESKVTEAREQLGKISGRLRAFAGGEHPLMISCDIVERQALFLAGHVEEAIVLQKQIVSRLADLQGRTHTQSILAMHDICHLLVIAKRFEEAETKAQTVLEWTREITDVSPDRIAEGYELIAECNMQRGDYEAMQRHDPSAGTQWFMKAVNALDSAIENAKNTSNAHNEQILRIILEQSKCRLSLGEFDQAKALCEEILREHAHSPSKKMSLVSMTAQRLLLMIDSEGRSQEQQISIQEKILDFIYTHKVKHAGAQGEAMFNLAESYVRAGRHSEAVQLVEDVLALRSRTQGAFHSEVIKVKVLADVVYSKMEMWEKAEVMQRDLLANLGSRTTNLHEKCLLAHSIGKSCLEQNKLTEAGQMKRLALSIMAKLDDKERVQEALVMLELADILFKQNSLHEAEGLTRDALKVFEDEGLDKGEDGVVQAYVILTRILRVQNRYEDLISCRLEILERDPDRCDTRLDLMDAYQKCGRLDEARSQGAKVMESLNVWRDLDSTFTNTTTLFLLASTYLRIGDYEDSMKVAEEALGECRRSDCGPRAEEIHDIMIRVLDVLRQALEHLGMETRLCEVSKELSHLCMNPYER